MRAWRYGSTISDCSPRPTLSAQLQTPASFTPGTRCIGDWVGPKSLPGEWSRCEGGGRKEMYYYYYY
jgi:hypothetical protein